MSLFRGTVLLNKKSFVQIIVLVSQLCKYNYLSRRYPTAIESELLLEWKKNSCFYYIGEEYTFKSMLEYMRVKTRCIPAYNSLCICIVGNYRPILIENKVNAVEELSMLSSAKVTTIYYILIICSILVPSINNDKNTLIIIM